MARRDDDDAPWLAEGVREAPATLVPRARLFGGTLLALAIAVLVGLGVYFASRHKSDGSGGYVRAEDAPLITADGGPDKIPPANPGGAQITGIDDSVATVAGGADTGSAIVDEAPEEPLARPGTARPGAPTPPPTDLLPATIPPARVIPVAPAVPPVMRPAAPPAVAPLPTAVPAAAAPPAATKPPATKPAAPKPKPDAAPADAPPAPKPKPKPPVVASVPADAPNPAKPRHTDPLAPADAPPAAVKASTVSLQLGAFSSADKAEAAWAKAAGSGALAGLAKHIVPVDRDGTTLYRLRASGVGADAAKALCARIAAAGNACIVAK